MESVCSATGAKQGEEGSGKTEPRQGTCTFNGTDPRTLNARASGSSCPGAEGMRGSDDAGESRSEGLTEIAHRLLQGGRCEWVLARANSDIDARTELEAVVHPVSDYPILSPLSVSLPERPSLLAIAYRVCQMEREQVAGGKTPGTIASEHMESLRFLQRSWAMGSVGDVLEELERCRRRSERAHQRITRTRIAVSGVLDSDPKASLDDVRRRIQIDHPELVRREGFERNLAALYEMWCANPARDTAIRDPQIVDH